MTWLEPLAREFASVFPMVFSVEAGRYVVTAGLASLITWAFWESCFRERKLQARTAAVSDYRRELTASAQTALIFSVTGFGMHMAAEAGWLTIHHGFAAQGPTYLAVSLAAMIIAHDAYFYWTHRAMHHPLLFRAFHWTHHKSKTPTPWTAYSFDAPEAIVTVAFVPLWSAVVPMHEVALVAFVIWQIVRNVMGHAGVELSPISGQPSRLFGWLNTTTHHDLHHQHGRSNYGLYFSWWDRLMGTEHPDYQTRVAKVAQRSRSAARSSPSPMKVALLLFLAIAAAAQVVSA